MKKNLLLFFFLMTGLFLSAQTVVITSTSLDPAKEGSLANQLLQLMTAKEATIEFDMETDVIELTDPQLKLPLTGQKLMINGKNKRTGNKITIKGGVRFLEAANESELILNDLIIRDYDNIAMTFVGNSKITATNCEFIHNYESLKTAKNNGGVVRINASTGIFDKCVFSNNRCGGTYGGAGICAYGASNVRITNSTFERNEGRSGACIGINATKKSASPKVYIANCTFANNIADDRGGAIYFQTATSVDYFEPQVINCTFVGNMAVTGGAMCLWSRTTTQMKPVLVNNLFVENYSNPWTDKETKFDIVAFYCEPEKHSVFPEAHNNLYYKSTANFFAEDENTSVDLTTDKIFKEIESNPWNEGDESLTNKTSVLFGKMKVALIDEEGVAAHAGTATLGDIEIPKTDQLGNARPDKPSVGAVDISSTSGMDFVTDQTSKKSVKYDGNQIWMEGLDKTSQVFIFDVKGMMLLNQAIMPSQRVDIDLPLGVYIVRIGGLTTKIVVE